MTLIAVAPGRVGGAAGAVVRVDHRIVESRRVARTRVVIVARSVRVWISVVSEPEAQAGTVIAAPTVTVIVAAVVIVSTIVATARIGGAAVIPSATVPRVAAAGIGVSGETARAAGIPA